MATSTFKLPDPAEGAALIPKGKDFYLAPNAVRYYLQPAQPLIGVPAAWYGSADSGRTLYQVSTPTTSPQLDNKRPSLTFAQLTAKNTQNATAAQNKLNTNWGTKLTEARVTDQAQLDSLLDQAKAEGAVVAPAYISKAQSSIAAAAKATATATQSAATLKAAQDAKAAQAATNTATAAAQAAKDTATAEAAQAAKDAAAATAAKAAADAQAQREAQAAETAASQSAAMKAGAEKYAADQAAQKAREAANEAASNAAIKAAAEKYAADQAAQKAREAAYEAESKAKIDAAMVADLRKNPDYQAAIQKVTDSGQPVSQAAILAQYDADQAAAQTAAQAKIAADKELAATNRAAAAAKYAADLPQPGSEEFRIATANQYDSTGPDGTVYRPIPANTQTGAPAGWYKSTDNGRSFTDLGGTGPVIPGQQLSQVFTTNNAATNAAAQAARAEKIRSDAWERAGGDFADTFGNLVAFAAIAYFAYTGLSALGGIGGDVDITGAADTANNLANSGASAEEIASVMQSDYGIDADLADGIANTATGIQDGSVDMYDLASNSISPEQLAAANNTSDPIAALNGSAGWTPSDTSYLESIGVDSEGISLAEQNNASQGYDSSGNSFGSVDYTNPDNYPVYPSAPVDTSAMIPTVDANGNAGYFDPSTGNVFDNSGLRILNAQETQDLMAGVNPDLVQNIQPVQLASADPNLRITVGGSPTYADYGDASNIVNQPGYELMPSQFNRIGEQLPPGAYYDPAQNAWFMPSQPLSPLTSVDATGVDGTGGSYNVPTVDVTGPVEPGASSGSGSGYTPLPVGGQILTPDQYSGAADS